MLWNYNNAAKLKARAALGRYHLSPLGENNPNNRNNPKGIKGGDIEQIEREDRVDLGVILRDTNKE